MVHSPTRFPLYAILLFVVGAIESSAGEAPTSAARVDLSILLAQAQAPPVRAPRRATQCPATPTRVLRPTPECGFTEKGEPRAGLFQCTLRLDARSTGCEEQCTLAECRNP
jgi:hypothetical protein